MANREISYAFCLQNGTSNSPMKWYREIDGALVYQSDAFTGPYREEPSMSAGGGRSAIGWVGDKVFGVWPYLADGRNYTTFFDREASRTTYTIVNTATPKNHPVINKLGIWLVATNGSQTAVFQQTQDGELVSGTSYSEGVTPTGGTTKDAAGTFDAYYIIRMGTTGANHYWLWNGINKNGSSPNYPDTGVAIPGLTTQTLEAGQVTPNDTTLVAIDSTNKAWVWTLDRVAGMSLLGSQQLTGTFTGTPYRIAFNPRGNRMAVSWKVSESSFNTKVYTRNGASFTLDMEITGKFGDLLDWTYDNKYLIDGGTRNARAFNVNPETGELTENMTLMTVINNDPFTGIAQAFSRDRIDPTGLTELYSAALKKIVDQTLDYTGLKITMLNETATFDRNLTDVTSLLAASEADNWPDGGVALTGKTTIDSGGTVGVKYNEVSQIVGPGEGVYSSLLVYEAATMMPVLFSDFRTPLVFPAGETLKLKPVATGSLLSFAL